MGSCTPELPDLQTVADSVAGWASANPQLAALLAAGLPKAQALVRWGLQLLKEDRSAEAVAPFHAAAALVPDDPVVWTNLGIALDRSNSPADAVACLETSVALSRRQPHTWLLLGVVRKKQGDLSGSEAAYRVALELDPDSPATWQCLGLLKEEQKDYAGAIHCFGACVKQDPSNAAIWANLGKLYYRTGQPLEACDAYATAASREPVDGHYREMARKTRFVRDVFEGGSVDEAIAGYRHSLSPADVQVDRDLVKLFETASELLSKHGHVDAAVRLGKKRVELWPASASARYLLDALVGTPGLDRSPPEYIVESFDEFAEGFDAQVVGVLGYDVPVQLCKAVSAAAAGQLYDDALDAGCGTGLCGPLLRPLARTLTGVDLSPKMLEQAAKRGVYDTLEREDLLAFLGHRPGRFDLVAAADVIIYFGDLANLFAAVAGAVRAGGLWAFSAELWVGEGYRLQPSGRFAHAPAYVRSVAREAFTEEMCAETTIRLDANERVRGNLFLFRRR
jgi:predicted TPR repeat methyltransferase